MKFENTTYLFFLFAIPIIVLLFYLYILWRNKAVKKIGDENLVSQLMSRFSIIRKWWKLIILLFAFSSFVIGLANLRMGSKKEKIQGESADVIICFDVSNSMLAEDVKPDRLTQAKFTTSQLIEKIAGNTIGLIVFAGKSYVQMPLTTDARAAMMYLNGLNTGMVPTQGTSLGNAIETAMNEFENGGEDSKKKGRAIIIITDGESHDENALDMAKEAADKNIKIITIGVGTPTGAPIPLKKGNAVSGFKKDKDDNIILTKLNENMLSELALSANGIYMNASDGKKVIQKVYDEIDELDKTKDNAYEYSEYANHFQIFLFLGLLLLTVEFFMPDKKPLWMDKIKIFDISKK